MHAHTLACTHTCMHTSTQWCVCVMPCQQSTQRTSWYWTLVVEWNCVNQKIRMYLFVIWPDNTQHMTFPWFLYLVVTETMTTTSSQPCATFFLGRGFNSSPHLLVSIYLWYSSDWMTCKCHMPLHGPLWFGLFLSPLHGGLELKPTLPNPMLSHYTL